LRFFLYLAFCFLALPLATARAEAVWFRGLFGMAFSTGIIEMAEGAKEDHHCWCARRSVQADIIARYRAGKIKSPIDIIGHSLGADAAQDLAQGLRKAGVPVGTVILLDATRVVGLKGFDAYNFMSRDFRARKIPGAVTIARPDLRHVPLATDRAVQRRIAVLLS